MYILHCYILHCDPSVCFKVQQTNKQTALVGIRACRGTYNNPLPKPMLPKVIASPGMDMVLWRGEVSLHLNYITQFVSYIILISLTRKYWTVNIVSYRQVFHIRRTLVSNHSDVVGASPVGAAPTTSSFLTKHVVSVDWAKRTARRDENHLSFRNWCVLY